MFIQVKLIRGWRMALWYAFPAHNGQSPLLAGTIVQVPLRNKIVPAMVIKYTAQRPQGTFTIKEIDTIQPWPADESFIRFLKQLAQTYQTSPTYFIGRLSLFLTTKPIELENRINTNIESFIAPTLTNEQQKVVDRLLSVLHNPRFYPSLLHGVTGSGKTEVYKALIQESIRLQKSVILLLPEVTLALSFQERLKKELPSEIPLYSFHSATPIAEKKIVWQSLLKNRPLLIIGVHLPILLPISNLGFIVVDEEHENGYHEKKFPKVNTKHAALLRAQLNNIPILFGSATPSLSTLYQVKEKKWPFFQLKNRFGGAFPTVQVVLLPENRSYRKQFWISKELERAIQDRLHKKEQTIIFLNRRGYSFFIQCSNCSFIFCCTQCSVSLTVHNNNDLQCHYCGYTQQIPRSCTSCAGNEEQLIKKGIGTQQVVDILQKLFPTARIARADTDITRKKKLWQQIVNNFTAQNIDILVGTQTVTKGYHFPNVTLVGILWADLHLHFPVFNASEITLQQLIQVAGRAGRARQESLVIVKALQNHAIFSYLNEQSYLSFYQAEMASRSNLRYPPFWVLTEIEIKHSVELTVEKEAYHIAEFLRAQLDSTSSISILGPAKPMVHTIKKMHSRTIYIKSRSAQESRVLYQSLQAQQYQSSIVYTPIL